MPIDTDDLLGQLGPGLTTQYIAELVGTGMSEAAARKRIQRLSMSYQKLAGIRFEKNARFIYRPEDYGDTAFWNGLEKAFYTHGKSYWAAVVNLRARGGACPKDRFAQISGAPTARRRQLSPDAILDRLKAIQLLEEVEIKNQPFVRFRPNHLRSAPIEIINAKALAEFVALHGIKEWARKLGLGSYNKFCMRGDDDPAIVSGMTFDLTAPSYFRPLLQIVNGQAKPGFLACDINLHGAIEEDEVEAFVRKCDGAAFSSKVGRIMPMLVGDVFSAQALDLAKSKGLLAITLENLFGIELAKALRDLVSLLTDAGATASVNPDHLMQVMQVLTRIEGASANLRGALFELVIGSLVKDVEGGYLKTGQKLTDPETGHKAEIDVQLDKTDNAGFLIIECKAKNPGARVSESDVRKWYSDRVPLIHRILDTPYKHVRRPFHFEIWTNGVFAESALKWLTQQPSTCAGYTIGWKDGAALKRYADRADNGSLRTMLNEHYFKNPMTAAVVARENKPRQYDSVAK